MKFDNFTTGKCNKCGWVKQFQPGKDYEFKEFECDCSKAPKLTKLEQLKIDADNLNIKYPSNIGEKSLEKKILEVLNGNRS